MQKPADANVLNAETQGMQTGVRVLSYLLAGAGFYGGLGWLGDRYFHTVFLLPLGIVLGMACALYLIIRWHTVTEPSPTTTHAAHGAGKESR